MPGQSKMRYAAFGISEMSEWDIKILKWGNILPFVKEPRRFNIAPMPRVDRCGDEFFRGFDHPSPTTSTTTRAFKKTLTKFYVRVNFG